MTLHSDRKVIQYLITSTNINIKLSQTHCIQFLFIKKKKLEKRLMVARQMLAFSCNFTDNNALPPQCLKDG